MKLYEYKLRRGKFTTNEYEVRETAKQYIVENGFVEYRCYVRIPKVEIGTVLGDAFWGFYYLSTENNAEAAKKAFIEFFNEKEIPRCENDVDIAKKALDDARNELNVLINKN